MKGKLAACIIIGILCLIGIGVLAGYLVTTAARYHKALKYFEEGVKYVNLELDAFGNGDAKKALEYFHKAVYYLEEAIKLDPNLGMAYYDLCIAYGNDGFFHHYYKLPNDTTFTQAIPWYEKYMHNGCIPGPYAPQYSGAYWMKLAQMAFEKAVYYCKLCIKKFPNIAPLCEAQLGAIYYDYCDNYTCREKLVLPYLFDALKHKDVILKYAGKFGLAAVYQNIARTYLAMAEPWLAVKYYEISIKLHPIDVAVEHIMWALIDLGKWYETYKWSLYYVSHWKFESDLGLMPGAVAAFYLGWPCYLNGDWACLEKWWGRAIKFCNIIITKFGPSSDYYGEACRLKSLIEYYLARWYIEHGEKKKGEELLMTAYKALEKDVEEMTDHLKCPGTPAEVPAAHYERALAYYYMAMIDLYFGHRQKAMEEFKKAEQDLLWLIEHPVLSNREVAHRNYYILGFIGLAGLYIKLYKVTGNPAYLTKAKQILMKLQEILNTNPEMKGWKELFERKYGTNIAMGLFERMLKAGGIPVYFGVLEH
ncbi:MAG: hypothetical protein GXO26_01480 [Crenarchaeota archaeon]|nr:hypothetical protein [Thermoproteota archaeon]